MNENVLFYVFTNIKMSITIKDMAIPVLNKPPHFAPRYCKETMDYYFNLNKQDVVKYLSGLAAKNDFKLDYNTNEIKNGCVQLMIKQDLLNALDDAILETFCKYNFDEDTHIVEDGMFDDEAKQRLENTLSKCIDELVFKRTANTCTPWGFI